MTRKFTQQLRAVDDPSAGSEPALRFPKGRTERWGSLVRGEPVEPQCRSSASLDMYSELASQDTRY